MKRQVLGFLAAVALFGAGQAHAVLIDNFDFGDQMAIRIAATGNDNSVSTGLGVDAAGGTRSLSLTQTVKGKTATSTISSGELDLSNNTGADSLAIVTWDGDAKADTKAGVKSGSFATPIDLLDGCTSTADCYLRFRLTGLDLNLRASVYLWDSAGSAVNTFIKVASGFTTLALVNVQPDPANGVGITFPGNLYHGLAPFISGGIDPVTGLAFGGQNAALDLHNIVAIQLVLDTDPALNKGGATELDLGITCFGTGPIIGGGTPAAPGKDAGKDFSCTASVPEPSTALLLGTGLLVAGFFGAKSRFSQRRREV